MHAAEPFPSESAPSRLHPDLGSGGRTDGAELAVACARRAVRDLGVVPLPGGGETWARWSALAAVARADLSVGRLVEGHLDAVAILAELGHPRSDGFLGVWAARPEQLVATRCDAGWLLHGDKPFCSGSTLLDAALVTATTGDGPGLFVVKTTRAEPRVGSWQPVGMFATRSETMTFDELVVPDSARVGGPDAYVDRPGFPHGGCGVAACWWGGTVAVLDDLERLAPQGPTSAAARAAAQDEAAGVERALREAAVAVDRRPHDRALALVHAERTRDLAAGAGRQVLQVALEHLGTTALSGDRAVGQRLADLGMYLTQHKPSPTASGDPC